MRARSTWQRRCERWWISCKQSSCLLRECNEERERGAVASKSQRRDRAIRFFTQLAQSGVGLGRLLKKIHLYIIDSRHTHARAHAQSAHLAPDRTPRVGGAAKAARHAMFRSLCMMRYLVSMLVHVARERYEWRRDDEGNLLLHRWLLHVRDKDNPNEKEDCTWVIFGCQVNSHHHTSIRPYVHTSIPIFIDHCR